MIQCLVCGSHLQPETRCQGIVYDGVICHTTGNYGSKVFDTGGVSAEFCICDKCFTERMERMVLRDGEKILTPEEFREF